MQALRPKSSRNGIGPPILKQAELIEAGETRQHQRLFQLLHIVNASFIRPKCMFRGPEIGIRGKYWQPGIINGLGKDFCVIQNPVPCLQLNLETYPSVASLHLHRH